MLRQDPVHMEKLIKKAQSWLLHVQWKKTQYGVLSCIKHPERVTWIHRTKSSPSKLSLLWLYLDKRRFILHRFARIGCTDLEILLWLRMQLQLYRRINVLWERVTELEKLLQSMSPVSRNSWLPIINAICADTQQILKSIKVNDV
ncbi:unnamed protein product [Gongylonema pulchrum]|uniref:Zf-RVT domain-containing protein n=1 Tax=Gongylonema pulchrum TaxID=637853 RepID=A0A183DIT8_9BILA|nr:unnamed protein product [Gongylonema pulchrum]